MVAIGYSFLIEEFNLDVLPPLVRSFLVDTSTQTEKKEGIYAERYFSRWRHPIKNTWQANLNFAIRYEGVNLEILKAFFLKVDISEFLEEVQAKPTGSYCRRIWFLYEFLTGKKLPLDDAHSGPFVELQDPSKQFSLSNKDSSRAKRQRIINNLPGNSLFCPMVRITKPIFENSADKLKQDSDALLSSFSAELLYRAVQFLYIKETKSSFAIERETPSRKKTENFVLLLQEAAKDCLSKDGLCKIQNAIVEERYSQKNWREDQVYVGETLSPTEERIHYIAPKPEDIGDLMLAYLDSARLLKKADCDPVIASAIVAFSFVFLHPFDDGNGRTHRYLLHHILASKHFTPPKIIFPVSATLLKKAEIYDRMLETFSKRLMPLLDYSISDAGEITVRNDSADFYRFMDLTPIVEEFQRTVSETIHTEWKAELTYLQNYDKIRAGMQAVVDMPEKKANQFILFVKQNGGSLPVRRREYFAELSDEEISAMEKIIGAHKG